MVELPESLCPPCEVIPPVVVITKTKEVVTRIDCMPSVLLAMASNKYCNEIPRCIK